MASILDLMNHVQQQGEMGRARGKETALGRLMAQGYQQGGDRSQLLGQIAQVSPQAAPAAQQSFNDDDHARMERVGQMAGMLLSAPPQARASLYAQQIVPAMHQLGMGEGLPPDWSDDLLPSVQGIYQQLGGGGSAATGVQSTYVDAQGNRVAIMRDGSTQLLGQNAPNNQIIDTGNGFFGVNKGNLQAAPVMTGGAPGEVPFSIDPSLPPEVQAAIRSDPRAGSAGGIPEQLRSAPKPQQAPTGYRYEGDQLQAIPGGPADPAVQSRGNDNGRNYVITTGPDGTIYRVNKLTGQADAVQGAQGGGASMANLGFKKDQLAVQKGVGANQIERGLQRLETAVDTLSKNKLFDGGPLDQYVLGPTKIGQEMEQAGGTILPALTALTRVPGVGSQSDWEGRLNMLQIPSVKFAPEVNRRAITGLRAFVADLKAAYQRAGIPFPDDASGAAPKAAGGWSIEAAD
jgi:hypothetical protein